MYLSIAEQCDLILNVKKRRHLLSLFYICVKNMLRENLI